MRKLFLGICIAFLFACSDPNKPKMYALCTDTKSIQSATEIAFEELYSSKAMDGKVVSLDGFFSYNFEDIALYPSRTDYERGGIWIDFDDNIFQDSLLKKINAKKIKITGTLNYNRKGHLGFYICTLQNVLCVKEEDE
jgi:hypothetical protein